MSRIVYSLTVTLFFVFLSTSCGWFSGKDKAIEETTEQVLYRSAQDAIRVGNFDTAIHHLEALEIRFPFGRYAEQAQLEIIFAHFMKQDFDSCIAAADRFINLHPLHPQADYAYYYKGLANFQRTRSFFEQLLGAPVSTRDVSSLKQSFSDFKQFLVRYPGSPYAKDARQRMMYLRNVLAQSELHIARYYLGRDAWVAAVNRAQGIIEEFPHTTAVPEALAILVEANYKLGFKERANDALRVLSLNFPDFRNFDKDGKLTLKESDRNRDRSWINMLTLGIVDRPKSPPPLEIEIPSSSAPEPGS